MTFMPWSWAELSRDCRLSLLDSKCSRSSTWNGHLCGFVLYYLFNCPLRIMASQGKLISVKTHSTLNRPCISFAMWDKSQIPHMFSDYGWESSITAPIWCLWSICKVSITNIKCCSFIYWISRYTKGTWIQLLVSTAVMGCNMNYCPENKDIVNHVFLEKEEGKMSNLDKVNYSEYSI